MTVAIVHHHLGPGGVSSVIAAASRCLAEAGIRHVILVDGTPAPAHDLPVRIVPGIGYLAAPGDLTADTLVGRLRAAALDALGEPPAVWHFHNHSLGKNPLLPGVVARLAEDGERLILQIHDLAEDGRPANWQAVADCRNLYPVSRRIRYAFLNSRDRAVFRAAGLDDGNSVLLENPVEVPAEAVSAGGGAPLLFAPVRGIRRKNLGELVFLAALAPAGVRIAISRAPLNQDALAIHDNWRKFAERQLLPIGFDVVDRFSPADGAPAGFESWLGHATHFLTTSVAEGFGLPFLEAAALGKPLLGRKIAHLAADHERHGILAGDLYDSLLVPIDWLDLTLLRDHLKTTLERNHRAYRRPLTKAAMDAALTALVRDGWLDFGNLPELLQQGVIERLSDPSSRNVPRVCKEGAIFAAQDWLAGAIANRTPTVTAAQLAPFSSARYGKKLLGLYCGLTEMPREDVRFLEPSGIVEAFLTPESFHFLLSAPPPATTLQPDFRAVIFDIYGTLLIAPAGGVKPNPAADLLLRDVLRQFGHEPPESPSTALHDAVRRHHEDSGEEFPEIDLRVLWRGLLGLEPDADVTALVIALEGAWHPSRPMPGAAAFVRRLARSGVSLGLLSNAQCNTLRSLGEIKDLFAPELTLLSYRHGIAKPSPALFWMMVERLAGRGISPAETLFIGNDPLHDIAPAAACGFKTALFTGHPDSWRPGECRPDFVISDWHSATVGNAR